MEGSPVRRVWPQVRAVLVALHVVAITLLALPAPGGGMNRAAWKEPTVQGELAAWGARLGVAPAALEERLWTFAVAYMDARSAVIDPITPYYRLAGTWQSWRMFVAPHRHPSRLVVEIDHGRGAGFEPLYLRGDPAASWRRHQLDHDRMRAQVFRLSWPGYEGTYARFAGWLAREAARDFPEARSLRVQFFKYRTLDPAEARAGEAPVGRFAQRRTYDLRKAR